MFIHKTPEKTRYLITIWESPASLGLVLPVHKAPQQNCLEDTERAEFIPVCGLQGVSMFSSLLGFRPTLLVMGLIKPEECTWLNPSEKRGSFEQTGAGRAVGPRRSGITQSQAVEL